MRRTVTRMSRFRPADRAAGGAASRSDRLFRWWHVGCISVLSGCLDIAPLDRPDVNHAPDIVYSYPKDDPHPIVLDTDFFRVIAVDPDGDKDLQFEWDPRIGVEEPTISINTEQGTGYLSIYEVPRDPSLDGLTLGCTVTDLHKDGSVTLEWQLEVEQ